MILSDQHRVRLVVVVVRQHAYLGRCAHRSLAAARMHRVVEGRQV
jgi:hypothetical protein